MWTPQIQNSSGPFFRAIVEAIRGDIAGGVLRPGERLPTHRELAERLGVARGTVMRAYAEATAQRLISGRVGQGTVVAVPGSGAAGDDSEDGGVSGRRELNHGRVLSPGVIELSANRPLMALDPDLREVLGRISTSGACGWLTRYTEIEGSERHREAGAAWIRAWGVETQAGSVVLCGGAQHATFVAVSSAVSAGGVIAVEEMTYPLIKTLAASLGLKVVGVKMDGEGMIPEALAAVCRRQGVSAVYCIPTIQNPTGATMGEGRRMALVKVAREYDLAIIEDDIHRLYAPDVSVPLAALAPERTMFIAATSKCVAGALRVAFLVVPERWQAAAVRQVSVSLWNVPPLMAEIFVRWLEDGTLARTVDRKRREARERWALAEGVLSGAECGVDSGVELLGNRNGLSAWMVLPRRWTSDGFSSAMRQRGVLVSPDGLFRVGNEKVRRGGDDEAGAVRLSLSAPETRHDLRRGLQLVKSVLAGGDDAVVL